jgi:hypothetical protein
MEYATEFHDSEPDIQNAETLRFRMDEDGYLFFKGRIPKSDVKTVYDDIWQLCVDHEWVDDAGNILVDPPIVEGEDRFFEVYDSLQRLESFHGIAHHFKILEPLALVMSEPVFVHPRNIGRISFPQATHFATPPHQDFPLIQGATATYTGWFPLMDCPQKLGGLTVLRGSHKRGLYKVHDAQGAGGMRISTEKLDYQWVLSDYEAGDLLIFHSHTVHKALPNITESRIRISADFRYSALSQPVVADGLEPHFGRLDWAEVYEGWTNSDLQYYWQRMPITVSARDEQLRAALAEDAP